MENPPMQTDNQTIPEQERPKLLAPVWHTIGLVILMLANSYATARMMAQSRGSISGREGRIGQYILTMLVEFFTLLLVWLGLRLKRVKVRDLVGGQWNSPEQFLIDMAIALGFWITSALVLVGLGYAMGMANPSQANEVRQRLGGIIPQTRIELVVWVVLCVIAGFVEEVVFRGYLQKQLGA